MFFEQNAGNSITGWSILPREPYGAAPSLALSINETKALAIRENNTCYLPKIAR